MRRAPVLAMVLACAASPALAGPRAASALPTAEALAQAAFAPGAARPDNDPIGRLLDRTDVATFREAGAQAMRIQIGKFSFDAGGLDVDISPHAGVGFDAFGGASSAEAGATVQLSKADLAGERLKAMGVRDGAAFGDQGRWYLFAAASGRAVGLNMLRDGGAWNRAGWSTDPTSKLVGDTQVGVGYRKGPVQTSLGFVHREVKGQHMLYGVDPHADSLIAFSFSVRPRN